MLWSQRLSTYAMETTTVNLRSSSSLSRLIEQIMETTVNLRYGHNDCQPMLWKQRLSTYAMVTMTVNLCYGHNDCQPTLWKQRMSTYDLAALCLGGPNRSWKRLSTYALAALRLGRPSMFSSPSLSSAAFAFLRCSCSASLFLWSRMCWYIHIDFTLRLHSTHSSFSFCKRKFVGKC